MSKIRYKQLPLNLELRLQHIWKIIKEYDKGNYKKFNEDFRRDLNPEDEIVLWERFVEVFEKCLNESKASSKKEKQEVYNYLALHFTSGMNEIELEVFYSDDLINKVDRILDTNNMKN